MITKKPPTAPSPAKFSLFFSYAAPNVNYAQSQRQRYLDEDSSGAIVSCLRIQSRRLIEDLELLGVGERKSHSVSLPKIPEYLTRHMIRGLFDGDGNLSWKYHSRTSSYKSYICRICCNIHIANQLDEILMSNIGVKASIYADRSIFDFTVRGNVKIETFLEWIYSEAKIYLPRKFSYYKSFKDYRKGKKDGE